jgi:hypothetical protein
MRLEKELGLEGYAIYFKLLEILRDQEDFKYPLQDVDLLADEIGSSEQKVRVVLMNYCLFENNENCFFSADLVESMQPYLRMKEQRINAGKASAQRRLNGRSTTVQQSKVKESKVKESKVNIYNDNPVQYFRENLKKYIGQYENKLLKDFFDYWTEPSKSGKLRFEDQKFFDFKRRLNTWSMNQNKFKPETKIHANGNYKV